jgi:hypothetical protein
MSEAESFPPYTFADTTGKRWSLKLTFGKKNKIKTRVGFDVSLVVKEGLEPLGALANEPDAMGKIVFLLCEDQLTETGTTEDQFLEAFDGATVHAAFNAFAEAIFDFFQNPRLAAMLREVAMLSDDVGGAAVPMLREKINVEETARALIDSVLNSQASSDANGKTTP